MPSADAFEALGELLDRFPGQHVRAFGEMVDVLSKDGRHAAAIALEDLWNELGRNATSRCSVATS